MTDAVLDREGVIAKFGIPPELIIDFLALLGDKSDNIPGVPGVGEKTALGLLQGLGGIDSIYQRLDEVETLSFRGAKTMAAKLEEHRELAYLSYQLATIKTDVEVDLAVDELANQAPDNEKLLNLFIDLEFKTWINELSGDAAPAQPKSTSQAIEPSSQPLVVAPSTINYETVLDQQQFSNWLQKLQNSQLMAVDTETTSLDYMVADLVGISLAVEAGEAAYIPFGHDYLGAPQQLPREMVLEAIKPILEDPKIKKVGQNLKYDTSVLAQHGIDLKGIAYDTMLESYVINSVATRHDMDSLAQHYLEVETTSFTEIAGKGASQLTFNQISLEQAGPYAAEDADITLRLHQALWPQVKAELPLKTLFEEIELPLIKVLSRIERTGALVDDTLLFQQSQELAERLAELETQAWELAGQQFNLASPKQLAEILFTKLEIPVLKKTAKGAPST
jgi:DNA polymerase-1